LRELQEEWTYDEVIRACAILDMYSAIDIARDAYDKAEAKNRQREAEAEAKAKTRGRH
jgi:hypothetical protein